MTNATQEERGVRIQGETDYTWEEIGFAEFPIVTTSLKRAPFDTLEFVEEVASDENGNPINRTWKMVGSSEYGLPRLSDLDVFMAILKLLEQGKYRERTVHCTLKDICDITGLKPGGTTYERVKGAFKRFTTTTYIAERVFRDPKTKVLIPLETWEIVTESRFTENAAALPSYFEVGKRFLTRLQTGQVKSVDLSFWRELPLGLEKPIYHYLDKNFHGGKDRHEIGLKKLCERIALTGHYRPYDLQRLLKKPLSTLVNLSFLNQFSFEPSKSFQDPVKLVVVPGPRARGRRRGAQNAVYQHLMGDRASKRDMVRFSTPVETNGKGAEAPGQKGNSLRDRYDRWCREEVVRREKELDPAERQRRFEGFMAALQAAPEGDLFKHLAPSVQKGIAESRVRGEIAAQLPSFEMWREKGSDQVAAA